MNYGMKGKVALVTGGSLGLGKAIVAQFLESEATVVFIGRNEEKGKATEKELSALGQVQFVKTDVSSEEAIKQLIADIVKKYGHIDYIVNNAAAFNPNMKMHMVDSAVFMKLLEVDLMGTFYCMKYGIEQMLQQETKGSIVNISSCTAVHEIAGISPYIAAKAAVNGLTRTAALDYAKTGIRINAVCPGMMETDALKETREKDPASYAIYQSRIPTGHISTPEEVAKTVAFLCSDESASTTGALFVVDNCSSV